MTRSILCGLAAVLSVGALALVPVACQSGGVGDPCTPEDEYSAQFAGFSIEQENIESRSFQCATRICLVNHFQGRVSCPLGQDGSTLKACTGIGDTSCGSGKTCTEAQILSPDCTICDGTDPTCVPVDCPNNLKCDPNLGVCTCSTADNGTINGVSYTCEPSDPNDATSPQVLHSYICHTMGSCQTVANGTTTDNTTDGHTPKDCCVPGTDTPVAVTVCGQCDALSDRNADQAVYCTCRCCAPCCPAGTSDADADTQGCSNDSSICGTACDPNFNYCSCPSGFTCTGIRTNVGLGDAQLAGAYCIKSGSAFLTDANCGNVAGHWDSTCKGTSSTPTAPDTGM